MEATLLICESYMMVGGRKNIGGATNTLWGTWTVILNVLCCKTICCLAGEDPGTGKHFKTRLTTSGDLRDPRFDEGNQGKFLYSVQSVGWYFVGGWILAFYMVEEVLRCTGHGGIPRIIFWCSSLKGMVQPEQFQDQFDIYGDNLLIK